MNVQTASSPVYFENKRLMSWCRWLRESMLSRVFVLADEHTAQHCLPIFTAATSTQVTIHPIIVPAGEHSKSLESAIYIWKQLLSGHATRNDCLVNLGGGMITDLGGFAASLYKRGMRFVHFPTSLLAQVDAAIGGKTGIDFGNLKNMIGTWSKPDAIFILPAFLDTLDERQIRNGWAEMMKHALIADKDYWKEVKHFELSKLASFIHQSVKIKQEIVGQDPLENNLRKVLNFGHTVGHALEAYFLKRGNDEVLHGEAVAAGMICESWIATRCCGLSLDQYTDIANAIDAVYTRLTFPDSAIPELIDFMILDKKNANREIRMALIKSIGEPLPQVSVSMDLIVDSLRSYLNK